MIMKVQWLGLLTAVAWVSTLLVSLSMMWHREWMEGDPPLELLTAIVFSSATVIGLTLGPLLCLPLIRQRVTGWHRACWVMLSLVVWAFVALRLSN